MILNCEAISMPTFNPTTSGKILTRNAALGGALTENKPIPVKSGDNFTKPGLYTFIPDGGGESITFSIGKQGGGSAGSNLTMDAGLNQPSGQSISIKGSSAQKDGSDFTLKGSVTGGMTLPDAVKGQNTKGIINQPVVNLNLEASKNIADNTNFKVKVNLQDNASDITKAMNKGTDKNIVDNWSAGFEVTKKFE
jgi:hypothetical protein